MSGSHKPILLSGIQPTNRLTLGNYLGALKNWVRLQNDYQCLFIAVDLHAITVRQDPKELRETTLRTLATYIAAGINPTDACIFVQSHVPEHAELSWVLTCHTQMGELSRMTQFKDKSAKQEASGVGAGLYTYPSLMAADILLYQTELVPVGEDQKQHLELTRDLALRLNNLYGDPVRAKDGEKPTWKSPLFRVPEPFIAPVGARVMSLQNPTSKMSKSDPDPNGAVFLMDSDKEIEKKFKRAVTDSGTEITWSDEKPGIKNLLSIQAAITGKKPEELVASYVGKMYGHLKVETANLVIEELRPIREKVDQLMADPAYLHEVLAIGADRARERATQTLKLVYDRLGFVPR